MLNTQSKGSHNKAFRPNNVLAGQPTHPSHIKAQSRQIMRISRILNAKESGNI